MRPAHFDKLLQRIIYSLFILFFFPASLFSQQLNWAFQGGSSGRDAATYTTTDNAGNVLITGLFSGTVDFDPSAVVFNLTSNGSEDIFVAKYNSLGQFQWAFRIGGADRDHGLAVTTDQNNNVIVTGFFRGANIDFDPSAAVANLTSNGDAGGDPGYGGDIFLAKYNAAGQYQWAFNIGGSQLYDSGISIAVDPSSNIYLGGYFKEIVDFDPSAAVSNLNSSLGTIFLAKYSGSGAYQWAFNTGLGDNDNAVFDLKTDNSGNLYVAGYFQGMNIDFDPGPGAALLSSAGGFEIFFAKYTTSGQYVFAKSIGGPTIDVARGIAIDNSGNIYVIGDFTGTNIDFNPGAGTALLSSNGGADVFLAKYDNNGNYIWAFNFGGASDDYGWKVSTDNTHLFITGGFNGTSDMNPSTVVDNLTSNGANDIFLGKYTLNGEYLCSFNVGGQQDDYGTSIKANGTNVFYLTGSFEGNNIDFDPTPATFNLSSAGGDDIFLSKFAWPDNSPPDGTLAGSVICSGQQAQLTFNATAGTGPFTIVYNNGATDITVNNVQSGVPFNINPNPIVSTTYTLVSIRDASKCSETRLTTATAAIVVNPCTITADFTIPDTVCVNEQVNITNTSVNATTSFWSFCQGNINQTPTGLNLGNFGGVITTPVFMDYVYENNNYYGFVVNFAPGKLIRLDFGNSLLNTPTATDLGNAGGVIPLISEGIQVVKNEGKWYAIIVAGYLPGGSTPRVLKVEFGTNITNTAIVGTDWGNIGSLLNPVDLHVFKENGNWYGFTVNAENNTITRFNFTSSFNNIPTAINLGNVGNLSYPTGIYAIKDNMNWRVFVVNAGNNSRTNGTFSLTRLDFGSSLLNTPTGVNLGNPGNFLRHPRDLTIMNFCGEIIGFAVNGLIGSYDIVKMNFNNDLTSTPVLSSLGNIGNLSFPHSISKIFRVGSDLYSFITNVDNSTITRLQFGGCMNSSIPNFSGNNPPAVSYNQPGTYTINLTIDDGLPTQSGICKQVVVVPNPAIQISNDTAICRNTTLQLIASGGLNYSWNPPTTLNNSSISNPVAAPTATTTYYVNVTNANGCANTDSVKVDLISAAQFAVSPAQAICKNDTVQINASGGNIYNWTPSTSLSNPSIANPLASPLVTTNYFVTITETTCNESATLSVPVTVNPLPVIVSAKSNDIDCTIDFAQLTASGANTYVWSPAGSLNNPSIANPIARPVFTTTYRVTATNAFGCSNIDSVIVNVSANGKSNYLMPSAFTPNNDGLNDCYGIKYWGAIIEVEFSIFNRWGERVFHTTNPADCWNGKFKGVDQKSDVYVYWIRAKTSCESSVFRKGIFALIR